MNGQPWLGSWEILLLASDQKSSVYVDINETLRFVALPLIY